MIGSSSVRSGRRVSFGGATGDAVRDILFPRDGAEGSVTSSTWDRDLGGVMRASADIIREEQAKNRTVSGPFAGVVSRLSQPGGGITVDRQTSRIIKPGVAVAAPAPAPAGPATNTRASRGAVAASPALAPPVQARAARARGAI